MEDIKRILVVSRMTRYCRKAVHYGVSLAQKYGAELTVMHAFYDPFTFGAWNLPIPTLQEDYRKALEEAKKELDSIVFQERQKGMSIGELIREGEPTREILAVVEAEKIDLLIMLAHEEGHLEHFLFGRSNEDIIRAMPCSVLMLKQDLRPVAF